MEETLPAPPPEATPAPAQATASDPDSFGYVFREVRGEGGADLPWVPDVREKGGVILDIKSNDSLRGNLPIGFAFPFYGSSYDRFRVTTNGVVGFGSATGNATTGRNTELPTTAIGGPFIAAFWDDLLPTTDKDIAYRQFGVAPDRSLVVEVLTDRYYDRICDYSSGRYACRDEMRRYPAFQTILHEDGRIVVQFRNLAGDAVDRGSATIGIQNENGSIALTYEVNQEVVRDGLAIQFERPVGQPAQLFEPPPPIALTELKGCQNQTQGGFRKLLQTNSTARSQLGCPRRAEAPIDAMRQEFDGGQMLNRPDTKQVLVNFSDQSRWAVFADTFQPGDAESQLAPPAGRVAPVLSFGSVWRQSTGFQQRIGWGLAAERPFHGSIQEFEGGTLIWTGGEQWRILAYYTDGAFVDYVDPNRPDT